MSTDPDTDHAPAGGQGAAGQAPATALLRALEELGYDFLAPTPASHTRVIARDKDRTGRDLADLLGWSLPCHEDALPEAVLRALDAAGWLERRPGGLIAARIRVSRVFGNLFIHSRFPTLEQDAVFLGPDSHRFGDYILRNIDGLPGTCRVLDYGAGAGVGGITAATRLPGAFLTLADINPKALALADANASHAGVEHDLAEASDPGDLARSFDLVVMHPPFMIDAERRAYRDGGDLYGGQLSLDWALAGAGLLAPHGRLVMHTGVSIVAGRDVLRDALADYLPGAGYALDYRLLDPDIFGDELSSPAYADVDRIAAVGLRIDRIA
ncbi:methyltransferase [Erythrobacter donghaensis]|uniref:methyltransferase n=1 Tax=Erythrobacter donghaensis TaxID=267135 RepID=UPI00093D2F0F|nr:methyltransferase [Erythrobacter donghaensis]